mgnify:CR=1 FL=1
MILSNLPTLTFFYILLAYLIGGITQGILGVGLITVVISLLSFVVDVKETIALVIIPTIITSFFQMINGNNLRKISIDTKFFLIFSVLINNSNINTSFEQLTSKNPFYLKIHRDL